MTEPAERGPKQLGRRAGQDDRSILAIALQWSSTVMTISIEMVVPGLLGYWADSRLGTGFLFLMLGMLFGVTLGIWQLVRLTQLESPRRPPVDSSRDKPGEPR
ncbi:MAG: AtpZ/AtpI family protein [Planctomycetaceae bacterium]|nr:AtpZ/AtpI family protein [Planctomycetaceae bacterium]